MIDLTFSLIIPCFNHGLYLNDCLLSLLNQSFLNWEAILINDGSSDNSKIVGESFVKIDRRFFLINQSNKGLSESRNTGISMSKGSFLLFLDADDWLEPDCLQKINDSIDSFPGFDIYRYGYGYWDKPFGRCYHRHSPNSSLKVYPKVLTHNLGPCHSLVIRKDFAFLLKGFDPILKSCEDWDFWIRAGKYGAKMFSSPYILAAYRYVPNSMSRNPQQMYEALSKVSSRAFCKDSRLPESALHNIDIPIDLSFIQKHHLIRCLGILIHHEKIQEAIQWLVEEREFWNFEIASTDWQGLSSSLTWKYFLDKDDIQDVLLKVKPALRLFFSGLGYSDPEIKQIVSKVLSPQRFRMNHYRFGKLLGGLINRIVG